MSFYRDVYLRSEDWRNLRTAVLAHRNNTCAVCQKYSPSNDVHHIKYRNLYDVKPSDLKVLCRYCHDLIHQALAANPHWKTIPDKKDLWRFCIREGRVRERSLALRAERRRRKNKTRQIAKRLRAFSRARNILRSLGMVYRHRLKWRPEFETWPEVRRAIKTPVLFLRLYIWITGRDPRKPLFRSNSLLTDRQ